MQEAHIYEGGTYPLRHPPELPKHDSRFYRAGFDQCWRAILDFKNLAPTLKINAWFWSWLATLSVNGNTGSSALKDASILGEYSLRSFGHHETVRLFLTKFSYMVL